jgi:tRNA(Arg) A34 adenosine deaminase TadA
MKDEDAGYLRRAIALATAARKAGDQPYGSVLVGPDGDVLAEDRNTVISERDITAHPELKLARQGNLTVRRRGIRPCIRAASRARCARMRSSGPG